MKMRVTLNVRIGRLGWISAGCRGRRQMESDIVEEAEAEKKARFSRRLVLVIKSHAEEEQPCLDRGLVCIVSFGETKAGRNLSYHYLPPSPKKGKK